MGGGSMLASARVPHAPKLAALRPGDVTRGRFADDPFFCRDFPMTALIGRLAAGPLDVVGDIHGEFEALQSLLAHLGYDEAGGHPEGRRLVFVGDLVDRGHDSPAVLRKVRRLVERGVAQAVIGNHELNLLRRDYKEGNGWFFGDPLHRDCRHGRFVESRACDDAGERAAMLEFLAALPFALERDDLRVVHACWHRPSIDRLAGVAGDARVAFEGFEAAVQTVLEADGLDARADAEERASEAWRHERSARPQRLAHVARRHALRQMGHPLRVLTSGVERETGAPFFSSGEWRFVERVNWWDDYHEPVPVVVGHYWRWAAPVDWTMVDKGGPDLFAGVGMTDWHGARRNVFCVDYSVGRRFLDRERGRPCNPAFRLGALRWPEGEVVFDDGQRLPTQSGDNAADR